MSELSPVTAVAAYPDPVRADRVFVSDIRSVLFVPPNYIHKRNYHAMTYLICWIVHGGGQRLYNFVV